MRVSPLGKAIDCLQMEGQVAYVVLNSRLDAVGAREHLAREGEREQKANDSIRKEKAGSTTAQHA